MTLRLRSTLAALLLLASGCSQALLPLPAVNVPAEIQRLLVLWNPFAMRASDGQPPNAPTAAGNVAPCMHDYRGR